MEEDKLLIKLAEEKRIGIESQKRRHSQWNETYALYRDIVETNELTQRQEVNIPIMKETKKTLLAKIDDPPNVIFDCLEKGSAGREKEIVINEIWDQDSEECNFEGLDILEKNNVLLFGRTFKKLNCIDGKFSASVPGRLDVVVDPKMNPLDIETAKFIVHLHIFRRLREVLANPKFSQKGKDQLKLYLQGEEEGKGRLIQFPAEATTEAKEEQLRNLGIDNFDEFGAADIEVELNEHFTYIWSKEKEKFIRHAVVVAADKAILYNETLKKTLGVDFWPFTTWADDLDNEDIWPDGMGDIVRTPNKVMNVYFSTMLENRVYRNLGMMWYLPTKGFDPQTFEPEPFGMYPAPLIPDGKGGFLTVQQVIQQMDIPDLKENIINIDFLIKIIERATAATAIEKGIAEKKQITLGEVQELIAKSSERIVSMAKFYRREWKEFAWKWRMIKEGNASEKSPIKLYKKSYRGNYFEHKVYKRDWYSKSGYKEKIISSSEQESEMVEGINKLILVKNQYPEDLAIQKIVKRRMVEILDLTPDEMKEIEEGDKMKEMMGSVVPNAQTPAAPAGAGVAPPAGGPGAAKTMGMARAV